MEVDLFVHGVPNGIGFWGKEEERPYFATFYDNSTDVVKFLVQTRLMKGKPYCYYNYLVYKTAGGQAPNVVAYDGRDGSYFGITLRFDAYCKDYENMFRILDTMYNVYIVGSVLKIEKSKLKYTIPDFASVSDTLKDIENTAIELIKKAFVLDSFTRLDGFAASIGQCPAYNLYDCTLDKVLSIVKQYGRIAISPHYPSNKEVFIQQQCDAKIQTAQQQFETRLSANAETYAKEKEAINASLSSSKDQIIQLQKEIGQKGQTINQLNKEVSRLQSELKTAGQNKKVAQLTASIKGPISELTDLLSQIAPGNGSNIEVQKRKITRSIVKIIKGIIPILNFFILLSILGILLHSIMPNHESAATPAEVVTQDSIKQDDTQKQDSILSQDNDSIHKEEPNKDNFKKNK